MLTKYFDTLRRRWIIATVCALATFALSAPFLMGLPKLYRGSATLMVEGQPAETAQNLEPVPVDLRLQAIKQEALSRARLSALIDQFNLYPELRGKTSVDSVIGKLQRDIKVENLSNEPVNGQLSTVAFRLSYVGKDPKTAADVTNALASFYIAQNDQMRSRQASASVEVLADRLASMKKQLDEQEGKVRDYVSKSVGALPQQLDANLGALQRYNMQLQQLTIQQMGLTEHRQSLQGQIAEVQNTPRVEPLDPNSAAAQLVEAKKQLAALGGTDKHPDVPGLKSRIATLEKQVAAEAAARQNAEGAKSPAQALTASLAETDAQLAHVNQEIASLRDTIKNYEQRVAAGPAQMPQFTALTSDAQATREQYETLQKRYEEAQLAERAETGKSGQQFRILDAAQPPTGPSGPTPGRLIVLAAILAIVIGIAAAGIAESLDTSFHTVDDVRAFTKVPVLVSIPQIRTARDRWRGFAQSGAAAAAGAAVLVGVAMFAFSYAHRSEELARLLLRLG
jgi:polysaccharide chain length determinant protein (PEP-CTERM system associated)